ncbi:MAG: hypothetical protein ACRDH2_05550, partial [Anaerolineales bacterium]
LANASVIFSLLLAGYAFWRFLRGEGVGGSLWGVIVVGELLYIAQAIVGFSLFAVAPVRSGGWRWVHVLYGIVMLISLPGAYAYLRGKDTRREALIYGLLGLFLTGVALRAMGTAG